MGNCWGSSAENPSSSADTRLSTTGTSSQSTSTMTMTTTSAGSSISPISRFSASSGDETSPHGQILPHPNLRIFTFAELKVATKNFKSDSLLGEGGFGKVFKGWLEEKPSTKNGSGLVIAVKRLKSESVQGFQEWQAEIDFLGRLSHPNLVKLIGYCLEETELLLVYEFMQKGSLENHLFGRGAVVQPLQWNLRLKIAVGAARGLAFLHTSEKQVIYRDFKASNILLDGVYRIRFGFQKMRNLFQRFYNAKISDFGLAKIGPSPSQSHVSTRVMGTQGYAAPEYIATGHLYVKSDVFGFGVVLVEILTGLRAVDPGRTGKENLVEWVKPYLSDRRKLKTIMDAGLQGKYTSKVVYEIAQLALTCLAGEPKARPSMEEVVKTLETLEAAPERSAKSRNRSGLHPAAHRHVQHQHQHQLPLPLPPPSPMQPRTPLHSRHNGFSAYQQSPQLRQ